MAVRAICVALLLSCLPIAGCGTVANLACLHPEDAENAHFGGVKQDLNCINKAANGECVFKPHADPESQHYPQAVLVLFCAADLPFSFIGDLALWPYLFAYSFINQTIPVPPVTPATEGWPQVLPWPENKGPEKNMPEKDTNQGKQRKDDVGKLPMPTPLPRTHAAAKALA
jgi:uncharacterized protein YceK